MNLKKSVACLSLLFGVFALPIATISNQSNFVNSSAATDPFNDNHPEWFSGNANVTTEFVEHTIVNYIAYDYNNEAVNIPYSSNRPTTVSDCFDVTNGNQVKISVTIPMYKETGEKNFSSVNGPCFYLAIVNDDTNACLIRLKTWVDSGGYNNADHTGQISAGDDWPSASTPVYCDGGDGWIKGKATPSGSFEYTFDSTNYLQAVVNNSFRRVDDQNNDVKNYLDNHKSDLSHVRFEISGDGGWDDNATVILNSINDKTFKNGEELNPNVSEYLSFDSNYNVSYSETGLLVNCNVPYNESFSLGRYDFSNGFEIKFYVPQLNSLGNANSLISFSLIFANPNDPSYYLKLMIWVNVAGESSSWVMEFYNNWVLQEKCESETVWINREVDGINGTYHLVFDFDSYFSFEEDGEMKDLDAKSWRSTGGYSFKQYMIHWFDDMPASIKTNNFAVKIIGDKNGSPSFNPGEQHTFIIENINGQDFDLKDDGSLRSIIKPTYDFSLVEKEFEANTDYSYDCYVRNVLSFNTKIYATFLKEDKETEVSTTYTTYNAIGTATSKCNISFKTPSETGVYYLELYTYYRNDTKKAGLTGKNALRVEVKDFVPDITVVTLVNPYLESYEKGTSITVSDVNVVGLKDVSSKTISLCYGNDENVVNVGQEILLSRAGLYIFKYEISDSAVPSSNTVTQRYYVNVIDDEKPVVTPVIDGTLRAKELINVKIEIVDDTDCDLSVVLTDADGYKTRYTTNEFPFVPSKEGQYVLEIRCEDAYGHLADTEPYIINVDKEPFNPTLLGWIIVGSVTVSLFGAFIFLTVYSKIKEKKI